MKESLQMTMFSDIFQIEYSAYFDRISVTHLHSRCEDSIESLVGNSLNDPHIKNFAYDF